MPGDRAGPGGRALLVAGSGGHLEQLVRLAPRIDGVDPDTALWVTYDGPQSRDLLRDRDVVHARYPAPRSVLVNVANARLARTVLRRAGAGIVVSTGASIAVSFLPLAARAGIPAHYIESATRTRGPSMTGRILERVPRVRTWCQYRGWAGRRWGYVGSVFDDFEPRHGPAAARPWRVVVTVGTSEGYGFRALIERLTAILPAGADVRWQTGTTDLTGLDVDARPTVARDELQRWMADADVVVSHAGIGSALTALEAGKQPVLVPRRRSHGEHIDDHQLDIADELVERGLATVAFPEELTFGHLERACSVAVARRSVADRVLLR